MKYRLLALTALLTVGLTGCASITDGTSQVLIFKLDPREARCTLSREGTELGSVSGRQSTISVGKSSRDIVVDCKADGYAPKTMRLVSSTQAAGVAGGFFLDLGITDMITGAMWKYQNEISVILERDSVAPAAPATGIPASTTRPVSPPATTAGPTDSQLLGETPANASTVQLKESASQYSYEAEKAAKAQQCGVSPISKLTAKGPGFENYSVSCSNGNVLSIRCEFGNCRVLR